MKVWIDQDLCTGDGLCVDRCPDVFVMLEDGIAYVKDEHGVHNEPGGSRDPADVNPDSEDDVVHAAMICPGECIFIEVDLSEEELPLLAGSSSLVKGEYVSTSRVVDSLLDLRSLASADHELVELIDHALGSIPGRSVAPNSWWLESLDLIDRQADGEGLRPVPA